MFKGVILTRWAESRNLQDKSCIIERMARSAMNNRTSNKNIPESCLPVKSPVMTAVFFLTALVILFIRCSENPAGPAETDPQDFSVYAGRCLRIKESVELEMPADDADDTGWSYLWEANVGQIQGQGSKVVFLAPDSQGQAAVTVRVLDKGTLLRQKSFTFVVYKQFILLRADDLNEYEPNTVTPRWHRFISYLQQKKIKACLGMVGHYLRRRNPPFSSYLKSLAASGQFEICNHGFTHNLNGMNENGERYSEFRNTSYGYQKWHLMITQKVAKQKLGITLRTFYAPGNDHDETTVRVLDENEDIEIWLLGNPNSSKFIIPESGSMEFPTGRPDFSVFSEQYDPEKTLIMYGVHPNQWDDARFAEFERIIRFLEQSGVTFITASEAYGFFHEDL